MKNIGIKFAAIIVLALGVEGCASSPDYDAGQMPRETGHRVVQEGNGNNSGKAMQCVPFARDHSSVKLSGDAATWWDRADGKYERNEKPSAGAVMVMTNSGSGHVAVVRAVIGSREIRVDHANWLNDGSVYLNDPVVDVSKDNDWSAVRVWNIRDNNWGIRVYPVKGFIAGAPLQQSAPRAPAPRAPRHLHKPAPVLSNGESPPDQLVLEDGGAAESAAFLRG